MKKIYLHEDEENPPPLPFREEKQARKTIGNSARWILKNGRTCTRAGVEKGGAGGATQCIKEKGRRVSEVNEAE